MVLAVIPARWASTRFPGKPLAKIGNKSMIQRVFEQVKSCAAIDKVVVATDDQRIMEHLESFQAEGFMTNPGHPSGTDRCAEVAHLFPEATWVLNVQGDEPFIQAQQLNLLIQTLKSNQNAGIATLAKEIDNPDMLMEPNVVKVVMSLQAQAIYFSRHPIPFVRGIAPEHWHDTHRFYKHIGLYGFKREILLRLAALSPTPLEKAESLEQLRWLENGFSISIGITTQESIGIDTSADLELAEKFLNSNGE